MQQQIIKLSENEAKSSINLGIQGEYNVREVLFDVSDFRETYGDGTAVIVHYPIKGFPYTVPPIQGVSKDAISIANDSVVWTIGKFATMHSGNGIAEIEWVTSDGLKKSRRYDTYCEKSIVGKELDESAQQSYIDQMAELAAKASELIDSINDAEEIVDSINEARETAASDIETAKENAVANISGESADALADINTAKTDATTDIQSAINSALTDLNTEKESAIASIRAAGTVSVQGETLIFGGV